jgi:asparagine synthase (glutamine-hydrolysing)
MSAIVGLFHRTGKPVDPKVLDTMLAALGHRGPDEAGAWHAGPVALGQQHRQLTPESCDERLPLYDPLSGLALVADCRLDNREDLYEALAVPQAQHAHTSDSQLLLLAYQQWGSQCVDHLLGDFAFAIWNQRTHGLFCACDPMGMRPLYIYQGPTCFAFATEIKGLLAHAAIPTRLNKRKLACLTVPAFAVLDRESTYFDAIFRLPAATTITVTAAHVRRRTYWTPTPMTRLRLPPAEAFEAFRELWFKAVAARLRSAFPVAALLSGGLDSSAVVATAAHLLRRQNRSLLTLSAVLPPGSQAGVADEKPFMDQFQKWDNIEMVFITDTWRGPFDDLERLVWSGEGPHYTSRHYLYTAFAEAATQRQARLMFDGCGGELGPTYRGDGYYTELLLSGCWWRLAREIRHRAQQDRRPYWRACLSRVARPYLLPWLGHLLGRETVRFDHAQFRAYPLQAVFVRQALGSEADDIAALAARSHRPFLTHRYNQWRQMMRARPWDAPGFSGYEHVSLTWPFLDKRVLEFCLAASGEMKVHNGYERYLIRAGLDGVLPSTIQWRTSKEPFSPDYHLRYNRQRPQVQALLAAIAPNDPIREVVDVDALQRMAAVDMQGNRGNTPADFAAMHLVPGGVYLMAFLRQFGEYAL